MSARHGDLQHVTIPLISIDQFSAKTGTDQEVIVVAFYLREEMAAHDLDEFVDKSVIDLLDCEVSPNPNLDGHWLVFVELYRQPGFWTEFQDLVRDVENLTTQLDWRVQVYHEPQLYTLDDPELRLVVPLTEEDYIVTRQTGELTEYFEPSALSDAVINEGSIQFRSSQNLLTFDIVDFGSEDRVLSRGALKEAKWNPMSTSPRAHALGSMLGSGWQVNALDKYILVQRDQDPRLAVLR